MESHMVIARAKKRCSELIVDAPDFYPLQSVMDQILYIESSLNDKSSDRSDLERINLGLFAVREFEARSPDFAELLYQVEDVVSLMKLGKI